MDLGLWTGSFMITLGIGALGWVWPALFPSKHVHTPVSAPAFHLPPDFTLEQRRQLHFLRYLYERGKFTPMTEDLPC